MSESKVQIADVHAFLAKMGISPDQVKSMYIWPGGVDVEMFSLDEDGNRRLLDDEPEIATHTVHYDLEWPA